MADIPIDGEFDGRARPAPDAPWLIDADDTGLLGLSSNHSRPRERDALVIDLRGDVQRAPGIAVASNRISSRNDAEATTRDAIERTVVTQAHQLTAAVAAIATADCNVLVHCEPGEISTALVCALTLLAAAAPPEVVAGVFVLSSAPRFASPEDAAEAFLHTLRVLDTFNGVECYLLRHGLAVEHFHALRERFREGNE